MSKYPRSGGGGVATRQQRPGLTHCKKCKQEFGKNEKFQYKITEYSYMRGDDEVEAWHDICPKVPA